MDYGLLDASGALLGNPHHYRDPRTRAAVDRVQARIAPGELYRITGLQHLDFNTIYQLAAADGTPQLEAARTLLLIPDLLAHWLTGSVGAEATNASTTSLYDASTGAWSQPILAALGLEPGLLPSLRCPGDAIGTLLPAAAAYTGLPEATPVTAVASHDTASAVVAVPAADRDFAYISCGTWSLAGLELDAPVLTSASRAANFTNELGIDGTVRYLRNIMGLWLLSESQRTWQAKGPPVPAPRPARPGRAGQAVRRRGRPGLPGVPRPRRHSRPPRRVLRADRPDPARQPGRGGALHPGEPGPGTPSHPVSGSRTGGPGHQVVHLVGGGSRNDLLCQLTADATGLPVLAGPTEATALGNVLVQARTHGLVDDRADMRRLVARTQHVRRYTPQGGQQPWVAAAGRIGLS
ncbi:hypothetical protein ASC99_34045 [Kitasatospora sp. Root107]|nr:hypothetical protein ASC99_34045 [Kitasatospora sp. Root107]